MFSVTIKLTMTPQKVKRATDKGAYNSLKHAALSIRKTAIDSMVFAEGPSKPGSPPHAHKGRIRRSILAAKDDNGDWFIGPSYSRVKAGGRPPWLAEMLEHGGTYTWKKKTKQRGRPRKGEAPRATLTVTYPARSFMQPSLERNLARFHREWQGAIS